MEALYQNNLKYITAAHDPLNPKYKRSKNAKITPVTVVPN